MRQCRICGQVKLLTEFYPKALRCKGCISVINRQIKIGNRKPVKNLRGEIWKNVIGHPHHMASNKQRIKAKERIFILPSGIDQLRGEQIVKQHFNSGYRQVSIIHNGEKLHTFAHRLIALAWIPNPDNKPSINHKNGIKYDNRISNLEWCTQSENAKHSFKIGTQNNKGENHPGHILTLSQAKEIKKMLELDTSWGSGRRIAEKFKVSEHTITKIKTGKHWNY